MGRGRQKRRVRGRRDYGRRCRDAILLALKKEEGAVGHGARGASGSWKRQGNRFTPRASRKERSPADSLLSAQ